MTKYISIFEDLMKTGDTNLVNEELGKLDPMFDDLEEVLNNLWEGANSDDRHQTDDMLQIERESVSKLKTAVKEWLDARDVDDWSM